MGRETDALTFLSSLAAEPFRHDFYQTLRRLECLYDDKPRLGRALRPQDDPVRLGQDPDLSFAPAPLASLETPPDRPPRLQVRLFGLLGPNGPLPLHLTEYVRERLRHSGDTTLSRFLDLFHHRFLAFLYQAWAQAQPHVSHDRPEADRFAVYVGAFLGVGPASLRHRDGLPDTAKFFHVGALVRSVRNAEGLSAILGHFFGVPVRIEQFVGHWLELPRQDRACLGRAGAELGSGAVLGARVWDRQSKFRICLGPLTLEQYESFLPPSAPPGDGASALVELVDWVRLYLGFELDWDLQLTLDRHQVPAARLGRAGRLGWTTWLGARPSATDADDLCLDAEASALRIGVSPS